MLGKHLAYPLFWSDEADTAMFGTRVLEYGYPRVHGPRNVVYQFGPDIALGVKERFDAYIGTTWGHFYFAVPGLWWAEGTEDPYAKTARVRLPFALAGAAGLGLWVSAVLPALGPGRRRTLFAGLFFLLAALSVSLLLHLREARYYALLVLLGGALVRSHLRYAVFARSGRLAYTLATAALLILLFNTFHAAYFAFGLLLALERAGAAWRHDGSWRDLAPFALSALLVAPLLVFFETFHIARTFAADLRLGPVGWAGNLAAVGAHFLRHEFLAPALVCRVAVLTTGAGRPAARRTAALLAYLGLGYAAIGCLNPLPLERYFVVLSPLVTALFLLDAFALVEAAPARAPRRAAPRARALAIAGLVLLTGITRWPAAAEVRGRIAEIATPYRGPLDFAIPHLAAAYERPQDLVIATNYEDQSFMYYLKSHVIVGSVLNNLLADRRLDPDVVVPRRRWPRSLRELVPFLARDGYERELLPVRDLHFNNIPALSRSRFIPDPHRFRTAETSDEDEMLVVYRRPESSKRTGTSSRP
jgi:hypothetical protein